MTPHRFPVVLVLQLLQSDPQTVGLPGNGTGNELKPRLQVSRWCDRLTQSEVCQRMKYCKSCATERWSGWRYWVHARPRRYRHELGAGSSPIIQQRCNL